MPFLALPIQFRRISFLAHCLTGTGTGSLNLHYLDPVSLLLGHSYPVLWYKGRLSHGSWRGLPLGARADAEIAPGAGAWCAPARTANMLGLGADDGDVPALESAPATFDEAEFGYAQDMPELVDAEEEDTRLEALPKRSTAAHP